MVENITLKNKIDIIEDDLKSVDGISEVSITGLPEKEIEIFCNFEVTDL